MVRPSSTESFERIAHLRERIDIREGDLLDQLSLDAVYSGGMISYRFAHDVSVGTASITFRPWYGWDRGTGSVSGNAAATNGGNTTFGDGTTVPQLTAAFGGQLRALGTAAARAAVAAAPLWQAAPAPGSRRSIQVQAARSDQLLAVAVVPRATRMAARARPVSRASSSWSTRSSPTMTNHPHSRPGHERRQPVEQAAESEQRAIMTEDRPLGTGAAVRRRVNDPDGQRVPREREPGTDERAQSPIKIQRPGDQADRQRDPSCRDDVPRNAAVERHPSAGPAIAEVTAELHHAEERKGAKAGDEPRGTSDHAAEPSTEARIFRGRTSGQLHPPPPTSSVRCRR